MDQVAAARAAKGPLTALAANIVGKMYDIEELVFDNQGLEFLIADDLEKFPNLQTLYIPHNRIRKLDNLHHNYRLCFLDARDNVINEIDLSKQSHMRDLYLSGNRLQDLDKVLDKLAHMTDLQTLDLRGNPATLEKGYRSQVIARFVTLKVLDGLEIPPSARKPQKKREFSEQTGKSSRPSSVLQYLMTRPLSAADTIVHRNADRIRYARESRRRKEEEEQTAVARRRKEEFEEAARSRRAALPDHMKPPPEPLSELSRRPRAEASITCRLFLKIPVYRLNEDLTEEEKLVTKQSPGLPISTFKRRMTPKTVHPK